MKLSDYARKVGVTYKTAYRWFKAGQLDAYQLETGTIIVRDPQDARPTGVGLYARVSSSDQREDLERQLERLRDYAAAKGYAITQEIGEIASGLNDNRPRLNKILLDTSIGIIVVEHKDRLTRFGFNYIQKLLGTQNRRIELINQTDTNHELVDDFVAIITSLCARIYGRRNAKRRAKRIKDCIEGNENTPGVQDRTQAQ